MLSLLLSLQSSSVVFVSIPLHAMVQGGEGFPGQESGLLDDGRFKLHLLLLLVHGTL